MDTALADSTRRLLTELETIEAELHDAVRRVQRAIDTAKAVLQDAQDEQWRRRSPAA